MMTSDTMLDDNQSDFAPRAYQTEIMEQAKSENLIVCLPTGSGKTYIAVMLIKELSPIIRRNLKDGGKRTILLVKTNELARQHHQTISIHLDLKEEEEIGIYCGSSKIKLQDRDRWSKEFENKKVLIFTVQTFLNVLTHSLFSLDKVNLLIFDECHHATGDDQYAVIMKEYYKSCPDRPRILGLTASIIAQKLEVDKLQKAAKELENTFDARIETGSDRIEINRNSTSVRVDHKRCQNYEQNICQKDKTVMKIFKEINLLVDELGKYLKTKKNQTEFENDSLKSTDQSNFFQLQCRTLDQLKYHLDNIIHIGYELGLYGFSLGIKSLRDYLKLTIIDPNEKVLYNKIIDKLDSLINNDFKNLTENCKILYSAKVLSSEEYIKKNINGQCIIFVERVYTAAFLYQVLSKICDSTIKIKYLAGSKAYIDGISVSSKYQREVVKEFRDKDINVLISTAIIEEGFDVPGCNLVIRFNKPQNFASYMQSKGRARAKTGDALFVLLRDEADFETYQPNSEEYENYEYMEKMLKQNFQTYCYVDSSSNDDRNSLKPYEPGNGVKINGIRAVQIINQYCAVLGNGQILSPRFCFSINESNKFKCVLSMPLNCPIREDYICENKNKKIAKQECCLKMVEKLYNVEELDQYCLPIRPDRSSTDDSSDDDDNDDETEKRPIEIIEKQIASFPCNYTSLSTRWHLYRIKISDNDDLGFVVPCELTELPIFTLYGREVILTVEVMYLKSIDIKQYEKQLEVFCRYLFEKVFDDIINTELESILKFDIEHSTFKLFPCFLTKSGDIDYERITKICDREKKLIQNPSELNDNELYYLSHLPGKQFYTNISDASLLKRASDQCDHKRQAESIHTYADYYEHKHDIKIQRDFLMATMKDFRKPRINYLKDSVSKKEKNLNTLLAKSAYYPIEVLRYAPLNRTDFELIYKLPSILVRISQLYYIEQLKKLLVDNIQSYSLLDVEQISTVTFKDCLTSILSSSRSTVLPLVSLNYNMLSENNCRFVPSSNLLFQSITRRSADENADMENLEILGDCFLKLAMSMSLYHKYPFDGSGKLTSKKDKQVSNENLYRLATKGGLKNYLYVHRLNYGGKEANWIPPGFIVNEEHVERYMKQKAKRKAFADMIEAIIGAFLISTNYSTTIKFMKRLGLDVIPMDKQNQVMKTPSVLCRGLSDDTSDDVITEIKKIFSDRAFADIEKEINYVFKNKAYLIAAFTHPSYVNNRLTQCYERLEYLGDAVLDFLVIRCVFVEHYNHVKPGRVTDIRQDLSNNGRLAYFLVCCNFHKKILHISHYLFDQMTRYCKDETLFPETKHSKDKLNKDIDQWADSTAPKPLADVFEALVGAIFLDSGYCLETVWKIIEPFLRQYISQSVVHPNLNPIRLFFENQGKIIHDPNDGKGDFICTAKFPDGSEFKGHGNNRRLAKYDACRKAMDARRWAEKN